MRRFFPLLLGLAFICLSFTSIDDESIKIKPSVANTMIKICDYQLHYLPNQNQCDPMAGYLEIDPTTCMGTMKVYLRVTNLSSTPMKGVEYSLPNNIEPLFYEYTYGGTTVSIGPIDKFIYEYDHNGTIPVYEWSSDVNFDLTNYCGQGLTEIFMDVRITDNDAIDYDLAGHSSPSDIFSCDVFEESCYYCGQTSGCSSPGDLHYNILACGESCQTTCSSGKMVQYIQNEAIDMKSPDQQITIENITDEKTAQTLIDFNLEITPNPFTNFIELIFNKNMDSDFSVELINTNGKSVFKKKYNPITGNSILLDVNDIPPGIYYCRTIKGSKMITKKIMKL